MAEDPARVLFVTNNLELGGAGRRLVLLACDLTLRGGGPLEGPLRARGVPVTIRGFPPLGESRKIRSTARLSGHAAGLIPARNHPGGHSERPLARDWAAGGRRHERG